MSVVFFLFDAGPTGFGKLRLAVVLVAVDFGSDVAASVDGRFEVEGRLEVNEVLDSFIR